MTAGSSGRQGPAGQKGRATLAVATMCLVLAACGGRPENVLLPVSATAPGASPVRILVATSREGVPDRPGQLFTGERSDQVEYADITVSIPPDASRKLGEVQWPSRTPGDPARDFVVTSATVEDRAGAEKTLNAILPQEKPRQVLLFVHGYNTSFDAALFRFAQIAHDSRAPAAPVLFTWPSRGRLLAYNYDRESVTFSRDALEQSINMLVKDRNVGEINLMAHSMGSWLMMETLRQMAIRNGRLPKKIATVILASPDIDIDVFRKQVADIPGPRPDFIVFVSQNDKALAISSTIAGNVSRLGAINPAAEPYRSQLEKEGITVIDLTGLETSDSLNHAKFAASPEVVRAIGTRLAAGDSITQSDASLGERIGLVTAGAASTVGKTAGLLISAPISVVDGRTRSSLGDQAESVSTSVRETVRDTGSTVAATPGLLIGNEP
ncbi:alpha/beta hydrolase [Pseudoxanthobacter sp.]|uniref:alpha/beta hydrolase n=1 Tax=Pseudoxanthobacter sp. TaxID=1925742 RepID=UPI002FE1B715